MANVSAEFTENGAVGPSRKRNSGRKKIEIDSFTEGVIRRGVLSFYAAKEFPSTKKLHAKLMDDLNFPRMSKSKLYKVMKKQLKFKFVKFHGKPVPLEREDIAAQRWKYLRTVRRLRREGYNVKFNNDN